MWERETAEDMGSVVVHSADLPEYSSLPAEYLEPRWYAAYTCANHEKRVAEQLAQRSVEYFLPLYESVRRWKDRRVQLQQPLFPGYVFVRLALRDQMRVLQIPSVVRMVGFNGSPAALPSSEIESLRSALVEITRALPHPFLMAGRHVQIRSGPLRGLTGILVRRKGEYRIVVSIQLISRSILVDTDLADIEISPANLPRGRPGMSMCPLAPAPDILEGVRHA